MIGLSIFFIVAEFIFGNIARARTSLHWLAVLCVIAMAIFTILSLLLFLRGIQKFSDYDTLFGAVALLILSLTGIVVGGFYTADAITALIEFVPEVSTSDVNSYIVLFNFIF